MSYKYIVEFRSMTTNLFGFNTLWQYNVVLGSFLSFCLRMGVFKALKQFLRQKGEQPILERLTKSFPRRVSLC